MTAYAFIGVIVRRWYVVLLGACLTVLAVHAVAHRPGVYFTEYSFHLLAPLERYYPNQLTDPHYALGPMAGVIVREWNGADEPLETAGDTTLVGEGRLRGVSVRVPNLGTQFQPIHSGTTIDVQVVGPDRQQVSDEAAQVRQELDAILRRRQDEAHIAPTMRITTTQAPEVPDVAYVGGSTIRAVGATGLVGVGLTGFAVFYVDRLLVRRRAVREARSSDLDQELVELTGKASRV